MVTELGSASHLCPVAPTEAQPLQQESSSRESTEGHSCVPVKLYLQKTESEAQVASPRPQP